MTGLEPAAAAAIKPLTAPFATIAAGFVKKRTLRYRVYRRVRKRIPFKVSRKGYGDWARSLTRERLLVPIETAAAQEANLLYRQLAAAEKDKGIAFDQCVILVQATWLSLYSMGSELDFRERTEAWAEYRRTRVLDSLGPVISPFDTEALLRRSKARTIARLKSLGVTEDKTQNLMDVLVAAPPDVPLGSVRCVVGPFGSGKSEQAELWHRASLRQLASMNPNAPLALWISARDVQSLETLVDQRIGPARVPALRRGVDLVVDGIDEVGLRRGADLIQDIQVYIAGLPGSRALVTSRDEQLIPPEMRIPARRLARETALDVVRILTESQHGILPFAPTIEESLIAPFFAIALGVLRSQSVDAPRTRPALIRAIAGLATLRLDATVAVVGVEALLRRLAADLVTDDAPVARRRYPPDLVDGARRTQLVTLLDDKLDFALPIFREWYAAQAVLSGETEPSVYLSPEAMGQWRWSLSVAVAVGSVDAVDSLVERITLSDAAFASWILRDAVSGQLGSGASFADSETPIRLERATVVWDRALGELSRLVLPYTAENRLAQLGAAEHDGSLFYAWDVSRAHVGVEALPNEVHPFSHQNGPWVGAGMTRVPENPAWVWQSPLRLVTGALGAVTRHRFETDQSPWDREATYALVRAISGRRSIAHAPIESAEVIERVNHILSYGGGLFHLEGIGAVTQATLEGLRASLSECDVVVRPHPVPDLAGNLGNYIGNVYSPERLLELGSSVIHDTRVIYKKFASTLFSAFRSCLGARMLDENIIVAEIATSTEFPPGSVWRFWVVPSIVGDELREVYGAKLLACDDGCTLVGPSGLGALEHARDAYVERHLEPRETPFRDGHWSGSSQINWYADRPASAEALRWLSLSLSGTLGHLPKMRPPERW